MLREKLSYEFAKLQRTLQVAEPSERGCLGYRLVVVLQTKFTFESGNAAGMLVLVAMITSLLTLIFGVAAIPRWQGFVALVISVLVAYYILFEQLYGLA